VTRTAVAWSAGALLAAGLAFAWAASHTSSPGPYYDEAFLAAQARGFLEPARAGPHPPGTAEWTLAGRPFPLRNAAYLGALKSQLALPSLAVFGTGLASWRLATFATALLAWGLLIGWVRREAGGAAALATGALVLCDPAFLYFGLYEWGPFTTLLLCRAAAALALCAGWRHGRRGLLAAGGLALGLGVFARADFAVVVLAAGVGALAARPALWREALARRTDAAVAVGAGALGALPMLVALPALLQTSQGIAGRGGLADKARVLWSTLDGSHFLRLLEVGGLFDEMFAAPAPMSLLGVAAFAALVVLALRVASAPRDPAPLAAMERFVIAAAPLLALGMWLLPGAVRAHHALNLMPLPHLAIGLVVARWAGAGGEPSPPWRRTTALVVVAGVAASQLWLVAETSALIERTGGRGRFTDAIQAFAAEVDLEPGAEVVSLDWGFHEPLLLLTDRVALREPIWSIAPTLAAGRPWQHDGDGATRYLVHESRYDLFGLGEKLLDAARRLPDAERTIRAVSDRAGGTAFVVVRFPFPHRLVFSGAFFVKAR